MRLSGRSRLPKPRPNLEVKERSKGITKKQSAENETKTQVPPKQNENAAPPKSPCKTPILTMKLNSRPKVRPNLENSERYGKRRCSVSESDENNRQRNPSGPNKKNATQDHSLSAPPPLQNVLRLSETSSKQSSNSDGHNNLTLNDAADGRVSENQRKRHQSAHNEYEDVRRKKQMFYKRGNKPPERSKMTMMDLIYWNPSANPMTNDDENEAITSSHPVGNTECSDSQKQRLDEEEVDNPDLPQDEDSNSTPVPQLKIGPDGNIILDEQTLVVPISDTNKKNLEDAPVVYEKSSTTTYSSFRKNGMRRNLKRKWSTKETAKFYQALCTVGTDFSMMTQLLPNRSRIELKKKFVKEDRIHKHLIDKAINTGEMVDMELIDVSDSDDERQKKISTQPKIKKRKSWRRRPMYDWSGSDSNPDDNEENKTDNNESTVSEVPEKIDCTTTDPTWKSYTITSDKSESRKSTRTVKKPSYFNEEFQEIEEKINKICCESPQESPKSLPITSENDLGEIASPSAQLYLVAQDSQTSGDQVIHVYMVSPAEKEIVPDSEPISILKQEISGIKPLNDPATSNEEIS